MIQHGEITLFPGSNPGTICLISPCDAKNRIVDGNSSQYPIIRKLEMSIWMMDVFENVVNPQW